MLVYDSDRRSWTRSAERSAPASESRFGTWRLGTLPCAEGRRSARGRPAPPMTSPSIMRATTHHVLNGHSDFVAACAKLGDVAVVRPSRCGVLAAGADRDDMGSARERWRGAARVAPSGTPCSSAVTPRPCRAGRRRLSRQSELGLESSCARPRRSRRVARAKTDAKRREARGREREHGGPARRLTRCSGSARATPPKRYDIVVTLSSRVRLELGAALLIGACAEPVVSAPTPVTTPHVDVTPEEATLSIPDLRFSPRSTCASG